MAPFATEADRRLERRRRAEVRDQLRRDAAAREMATSHEVARLMSHIPEPDLPRLLEVIEGAGGSGGRGVVIALQRLVDGG